MTTKGFVYIWEYIVKEECIEEFKRIYNPTGDWAQLFRQADGYLATDLHQDISNPERFITIDFWNSKADRDSFRLQFSNEFVALDKQCEKLTTREKLLGDFYSYTD